MQLSLFADVEVEKKGLSTEQKQAIYAKILAVSTCPLKKAGIKPVMPIGDGSSQIMFIGEAPGAKEDELGEPFVGASGHFLNTVLLPSVGLTRQNIYLTNIVKCRPPDNRDPTEEEKKAWSEVLLYELYVLQPKLVVCLGRHSMGFFLGERVKISQIHGQVHTATIKRLGNLQQKVLPLYHPAVALYNPEMQQVLKEDFLKIKDFLN